MNRNVNKIRHCIGRRIGPIGSSACLDSPIFDSNSCVMLQVLYPVLQSHSVANPDAADLFYIPIFTAQLYHSLLLTAEKGHAGSMNETATMVSRALQWVKTEFPYWNRTNGLVFSFALKCLKCLRSCNTALLSLHGQYTYEQLHCLTYSSRNLSEKAWRKTWHLLARIGTFKQWYKETWDSSHGDWLRRITSWWCLWITGAAPPWQAWIAKPLGTHSRFSFPVISCSKTLRPGHGTATDLAETSLYPAWLRKTSLWTMQLFPTPHHATSRCCTAL